MPTSDALPDSAVHMETAIIAVSPGRVVSAACAQYTVDWSFHDITTDRGAGRMSALSAVRLCFGWTRLTFDPSNAFSGCHSLFLYR